MPNLSINYKIPIGNPNSYSYQGGEQMSGLIALGFGDPELGLGDASSIGEWLGGLFRKAADGCLGGGDSFTPGTQVLLANGETAPISSLKPGDKVLATNTKTGKTSPESVAAVEVNHDTDLYDLKVKTSHGIQVIHTTSNHLFWDPYQHQWIPAAKLKPGEPLKTADGQLATASGGTSPKIHDGWMWDLTIPGNNDHDFYVVASTVAGEAGNSAAALYPMVRSGSPILVHNDDACGVSFTALQLQKKFKHASDFGVQGNYNPANANNFADAIRNFLNGDGTVTKPGYYHNTPSLLSYNLSTRLGVVRSTTGQFVSGWRLSPAQLTYVIEKGRLGGG